MLAAEPARSALLAALRARRRGDGAADGHASTLLDLDWRPTLWDEPAAYPAQIAAALDGCDVVVGSVEEFVAARLTPEDAARRGGVARTVIVKRGPDGASITTPAGRDDAPGIAVEVVCGLGAGDALTAAVAAALLAGADRRSRSNAETPPARSSRPD